ncbi:hypothetical protein CSUI_005006 [Cystoisospora suis]|uniref:Uncharacterized protein n=1 Tax=Cystoisospora suis TaxID=483139 RepID=A0A2C6KKY2_9APIC|nr:hypothetical protein CSUI_005006 [Cystoisospora suis]
MCCSTSLLLSLSQEKEDRESDPRGMKENRDRERRRRHAKTRGIWRHLLHKQEAKNVF